jgi:hypothetical protein
VRRGEPTSPTLTVSLQGQEGWHLARQCTSHTSCLHAMQSAGAGCASCCCPPAAAAAAVPAGDGNEANGGEMHTHHTAAYPVSHWVTASFWLTQPTVPCRGPTAGPASQPLVVLPSQLKYLHKQVDTMAVMVRPCHSLALDYRPLHRLQTACTWGKCHSQEGVMTYCTCPPICEINPPCAAVGDAGSSGNAGGISNIG